MSIPLTITNFGTDRQKNKHTDITTIRLNQPQAGSVKTELIKREQQRIMAEKLPSPNVISFVVLHIPVAKAEALVVRTVGGV